jgi:hypothetical protein
LAGWRLLWQIRQLSNQRKFICPGSYKFTLFLYGLVRDLEVVYVVTSAGDVVVGNTAEKIQLLAGNGWDQAEN